MNSQAKGRLNPLPSPKDSHGRYLFWVAIIALALIALIAVLLIGVIDRQPLRSNTDIPATSQVSGVAGVPAPVPPVIAKDNYADTSVTLAAVGVIGRLFIAFTRRGPKD